MWQHLNVTEKRATSWLNIKCHSPGVNQLICHSVHILNIIEKQLEAPFPTSSLFFRCQSSHWELWAIVWSGLCERWWRWWRRDCAWNNTTGYGSHLWGMWSVFSYSFLLVFFLILKDSSALSASSFIASKIIVINLMNLPSKIKLIQP